MKRLLNGVLALLALGSAQAATTVTFVDPAHFADVPFSPVERERVLAELRTHFEKLGATLPPGQDLQVEVVDLDLAGISRPTASQPEVRVLRGGADWPSMQLRYRIVQDGQAVKGGEERLSEMTYLQDMNRYPSGTSLRYEKQMIDNWWRQRVLATR